jgi:hypothetical protein
MPQRAPARCQHLPCRVGSVRLRHVEERRAPHAFLPAVWFHDPYPALSQSADLPGSVGVSDVLLDGPRVTPDGVGLILKNKNDQRLIAHVEGGHGDVNQSRWSLR